MRSWRQVLCYLSAITMSLASTFAEPGDLLPEPSQTLPFGGQVAMEFPGRSELSAEKVFLAIEARISTENYQSGSAAAMVVTVNGGPVTLERLVNKPWFYYFRPNMKVAYYREGQGQWVLPYYPFEGVPLPDPQIHTYVFDITSLLRDEPNRVVIENVFDAVPNSEVVVRRVRVLSDDRFPRSPTLNEPATLRQSEGLDFFRQRAISLHKGLSVTLDDTPYFQPTLQNTAAPRQTFDVTYTLEAAADGQLSVEVNGQRYRFTSWLGVPGEGWKTLADWQIQRDGEKAYRVVTPRWTLHRQLIRHGSHLEVRDTLTNRTAQDLPMGVLNAMDVGDPTGIREFRVAGMRQNRFWASTRPERNFSTAPIIFVGQDRSGAALVVEDDAYRNQGSVLAWDATAAVGTDMFYLQPGGSYTFSWKAYPVERRDYYAVVNALRHDWQLYEEIPGLFGFVYPHHPRYDQQTVATPEGTAAFLERTGIDIAGVTAEERAGTERGRMVYGNESADRIRAAAENDAFPFLQRVRANAAETQVVMYLDVHLINDGGDRSKLLELGDSVILNADGEPHPFRTGWLYHVLPRRGSASEARVLEAMRIYLDEYGFDGLFLDEWAHSNARVSYAHEDGMSALLDKHLQIQRKVGIVPILLKDFHVSFAAEAKRRDAFLIANHFDSTQAAADLPVVHFAEPVSYNDPKLAAAQVGRTPLSLNLKRSQGAWGDALAFLEKGVLLCYYAKRLTGDHALKHIYPITVREVHPGYVIGERKIVTRRSGQYSFGRRHSVTVYVYGGEGGQFIRSYQQASGTEATLVSVDLDPGNAEMAVIVEDR